MTEVKYYGSTQAYVMLNYFPLFVVVVVVVVVGKMFRFFSNQGPGS